MAAHANVARGHNLAVELRLPITATGAQIVTQVA